jgi:signal transduction histidine kinase
MSQLAAPRSLRPVAKKAFPLPQKLTRRITRVNVVPLAVGFTLLAALGDYLTGVEITFTLAYLCPISLGTWFRGRGFGASLAGLATACAFATSFSATPRQSILTILWNDGGALGLLLLAVWMLDRLRSYLNREQAERRIAVEQLRHADRLNVIGKLAAGVAHELGTPLNVVAGHAELLGLARRTPESIDESARTILRQTKRMAAIIRHLLDFGRESGSEKTTVNLDDLTVAAARMLANTALKTGCTVVVAPSSVPVLVLANAAEIEQVLTNLIINAVQAMPDGGVVRLRTAVEHAPGVAGSGSSFGCVSVVDQGSGISESNIARVFDPFFTTKGVGEGTGLGLSVSYGIVSDHGGRIDVESSPGRGTSFSVRLPLLAETE